MCLVQNKHTGWDAQHGHPPVRVQGGLCLGPGCPSTSLPGQSRAPGLLQKDSGATTEPGTALRAAGGCRVHEVSWCLALFTQGFLLGSQSCLLEQL